MAAGRAVLFCAGRVCAAGRGRAAAGRGAGVAATGTGAGGTLWAATGAALWQAAVKRAAIPRKAIRCLGIGFDPMKHLLHVGNHPVNTPDAECFGYEPA